MHPPSLHSGSLGLVVAATFVAGERLYLDPLGPEVAEVVEVAELVDVVGFLVCRPGELCGSS